MPNTSTAIDLGNHALEIDANGSMLIASHPQSAEIPIREVVQLDSDEAYRLFVTLRERYVMKPQNATPDNDEDDHTDGSGYYVPPRLVAGWKAAAALASTPAIIGLPMQQPQASKSTATND